MMAKKKGLLMAALLCTAAFSFSAFAGEPVGPGLETAGGEQAEWVSEGTFWKYRLADGSFCTDAWQKVKGLWYYFDTDGNMVTGQQRIDGVLYFFDPVNGDMLVNKTVAGADGRKYSIGKDGAAVWKYDPEDAWVKEESGWRYLNQDGSYKAGEWLSYKGQWYYLDAAGWMVTGLQTVDGSTYFFDRSNGNMLENTTVTDIDGHSYTIGSDGTVAWPYKAVTVIPPESQKSDEWHALDAICDDILSGIITPEMTKRQKAVHIYNWIRGNMRYIASHSGSDWVHEAYMGFRKGSGECFTYYSVAQALLTRAGMECIPVTRVGSEHYWVMVKVEEGWYHFDATPRRGVNDSFCLLTHAQAASYGSVLNCDWSLYPPTP